jgi:Na+-driven multidrug efflux pump
MSSGIGALWGLFMGLLFFVFPEFFVGIFTDNTTLINVSLLAMTFMALNSPFLNFTVVLSGALRGAGDTKSVMVITTLRLWLIFVPLNYILVQFLDYGIESVWMAEMTSFLIFSIIMFLRFERGKWADIKIYEDQSKIK